MSVKFTDNEIVLLLLLVFITLINSVVTIISANYSNIYKKKRISLANNLLYSLSNLTNYFQLFISIYFLFIKDIRTPLYLVLFLSLIIKAALFIFISNKTDLALNLSVETRKKIRTIQRYNYAISTFLFLFLTLYVVKNVFFV